MKHAKPGISLIEVMIAVLMLAAAAASLMGLQGTLFRGISTGHSFIERLGFIRSFFVVTQKEKRFKSQEQESVHEDPPFTLRFQAKAPTSAGLAKQKHLVIQEVQAEWDDSFGTRVERFARVQFMPSKERA